MFGNYFSSMITGLFALAMSIFYRFCMRFVQITLFPENLKWLSITLTIIAFLILIIVTEYLQKSGSGFMRFLANVFLYPLYVAFCFGSFLFPDNIIDNALTKSSFISLAIAFAIILIIGLILSACISGVNSTFICILIPMLVGAALIAGTYFLFKLVLPQVIEPIEFLLTYPCLLFIFTLITFAKKWEAQNN